MISWYAVRTKPLAEARALENLRRQGYRAYLPRARVELRHARRRRIVLRPLFPRYLFAGLDRSSMPWRPILSTFGVSDLVRVGGEPARVPPEIVAALEGREAAGAFDRVGRSGSLRLGDLVRVTSGVFEEMIGRLVELREGDRVVVLLDFLGRAVRAELPQDAVAAA
jgi:transcriptional antiterminator RfaH